jgi:diguanylate cyclase (GGDEF)-like protein
LSEPGAETQSSVGNPYEQEIKLRLASVRIGLSLSIVVCVGSAIYALATWDGPNREWILLLIGAGLLGVPIIYALPWERIARGRWRDDVFLLWSLADVLLITATIALDGGTRSPYSLLLVLPLLFASLSYPVRTVVVVGLLEAAAFLLVAFLVGGGLIYSGFGGFALVCVALLSGWEARNQSTRREELARTALALQESERTTRMRASQQREVARFGQLALGGADIESLQDEATRLLQEVLGIDIAAVLKLLPDEDELEVVSEVGTDGAARGARVPTGYGSQAGHCLATEAPTVVEDWAEETRFETHALVEWYGVVSGATVLIKGAGEPYGALGVHTATRRDFTVEDISFMEGIANALANAIDRRAAEERTQHEALHDPLTGLPNRNLFLDRLRHALDQAKRHDSAVAVLFLDLDQFKLVNDSLGHAAGDELLAAVAPRLEEALRPGDTVARFGGDEFAILAEDIANERGAIRVAERIAETLAGSFVLRNREHFVSASIGISIAGGNETPEALIRDADAALYRAKERGRGGYEIFDEVMRSRVIEHVQTENDLRRALQRDELELHYQPIVSIPEGTVVVLEALLRWRHPERGLLPPAAFIPVAEESRLIVPIGRWVLEQACREAARWQQRDPDAPPVGVAVNLSPRQLGSPDLLGDIKGALGASGIEASTLRLELTENTLLEDTEAVEASLESLRALGTRLVLDDFGIGFSSLGYLKRLPLSAIKLDRSFVEHLTRDSDDAAIVQAVSHMAEALGINVVAEGVETEDQLRAVEELGCGYAQGYFFARPAPADELESVLADPIQALS